MNVPEKIAVVIFTLLVVLTPAIIQYRDWRRTVKQYQEMVARGAPPGLQFEVPPMDLELVTKVTELTQALNQQIATTEEWKRRAGQFQGMNESILKERDRWRDLHQAETVGHANAQVLLLERNQYLERCAAKGVPPQPCPEIIRQTVEEYRRDHLSVVLEMDGTQVIRKGSNSVDNQESS